MDELKGIENVRPLFDDDAAPRPRPDVKRDGKGRFKDSGNIRGRPKKTSGVIPNARRRAILAVADRRIELKIEGRTERMTLFDANALQLATDGARGNRVAAKTFLEMVMSTAVQEERYRGFMAMMLEGLRETEAEVDRLRRLTQPQEGQRTIPWADWREMEAHEAAGGNPQDWLNSYARKRMAEADLANLVSEREQRKTGELPVHRQIEDEEKDARGERG